MSNKIQRWWEEDYVPQMGGQNNLYNITNSFNSRCAKFNCEQKTFDIKFNDVSKTFGQAQSEITQLFVDLHTKFANLMGPKDYIRVTFMHKEFDRPIGYPFMTKNTLMTTNLQHTFENVIQSYKSIKMNAHNELKAMVVIAKLPSGSGYNPNSLQNYYNDSSNIITIKNDDHYCLIRAVVVAIEYLENKLSNKPKKSNYNPLSQRISNKVFETVTKLRMKNKPCGIDDAHKLEVYFKHYQITIINNEGKFDKVPLYAGKKNIKHIYLSYTDSHYNVIKFIKRFYNRSYFCPVCLVAYNNLRNHKCKNLCTLCNRYNCEYVSNKFSDGKYLKLKCEACDKICHNDVCLNLHLNEFCKIINKCDTCKKTLSAKMTHVCIDQKYCRNCQTGVELDHTCYILTEDEKDVRENKLGGYIWFDYETYQVDDIHIANLVVAEKACIKCINNKKCISDCDRYKFHNNQDFCNWLFTPTNETFTAIAHNFQGFDGLFIMKHIKETHLPIDPLPNLLMNGTKILSLTYKKVRMIDSFSFIPMALENFTKTFGIKELKKGFWCHAFNKPENFGYVGSIPDKSYYTPHFFSEKKKKEFDIWYECQKDKVFDFDLELENYCISDVQLLREGTLNFRQNIINLTDGLIDPFHRCITIASLCHLVYRSVLMESNTIGIVPLRGFNPKQKTSNMARQWLQYESEKYKIHIQHARNGGERQFGPYFVDGFCESTKTIYEFHGCLWHGCSRCFNKDTFNNMKKEFFATTLKKSNERINALKQLLPSYTFKIMWECDFNLIKKESNDNIYFFKYKCPTVDAINPRDCLFGGRTNAIRMYHKCQNNEKIKYYDFTSLYPYVQKYCEYPIGQPTIITENFGKFDSYFGLIKCKILPPSKLFFPVLPMKLKNKLFFTLCGLCAENNTPRCTHTDEQRCLVGSWVTLEVKEAIKQGYIIQQIYEVWHYDKSSKYDKESKTGGIFTKYVNLFLKYKQEASGFPEECVTQADKDEYIKTYFEKEGIKLDESNINKNPGLRSVMKLMLNSFWGRFGMDTNKTMITFVNRMHEWTKLLVDDNIEISNVDFGIPDVLTVFYKHKNSTYDGGSSNTQTNVVLASFVTCHARLKLLSEMQKLGKRVLYHDTDSIIFLDTGKTNEYIPKLGNFLGDLTNEISPEQGSIIEFVGKAPKDYCYKTENGETKCTIKGFRLNYATNLQINFDEVKNIVLNDREKTLNVDQLKFQRNKNEFTVNTSVIKKLYSFKYDKRIMLPDYFTLPFGYFR